MRLRNVKILNIFLNKKHQKKSIYKLVKYLAKANNLACNKISKAI